MLIVATPNERVSFPAPYFLDTFSVSIGGEHLSVNGVLMVNVTFGIVICESTVTETIEQ